MAFQSLLTPQVKTIKVRDKVTNRIFAVKWDKPDDPTEYEIDQLISGLNEKSPVDIKHKPVEPVADVTNSPSGLSKLADRAYGPLTTIFSRGANALSQKINPNREADDTPSTKAFMGMMGLPFISPARASAYIENAGQGLDQATSPINLALMGIGKISQVAGIASRNMAEIAQVNPIASTIRNADIARRIDIGAKAANLGVNTGIGAVGLKDVEEGIREGDINKAISGAVGTAFGVAGGSFALRNKIPNRVRAVGDIIPERPLLNDVTAPNPPVTEAAPDNPFSGVPTTYKKVKLQFENPIDHAAYLVKTNKNGRIVKEATNFLVQTTGLTPEMTKILGKDIAQHVDELYSNSDTDSIVIPKLFDPTKSVVKQSESIVESPIVNQPIINQPIEAVAPIVEDKRLIIDPTEVTPRDLTAPIELTDPIKNKELTPTELAIQSIRSRGNPPVSETWQELRKTNPNPMDSIHKQPEVLPTEVPKTPKIPVFGGNSGDLRYNYGDTSFNLKFADDIDKALFTVSDHWDRKTGMLKKKSPNDAVYMSFLKQQFPDVPETEIRKWGREIREHVRPIAKQGKIDTKGEGGDLVISKYKPGTLSSIRSENEARGQSLKSDIGAVSLKSNVYDRPLTKYDNYEKAFKESLATTSEPKRTRLLTPDGTRLSTLGEHAQGVNLALEQNGIPSGEYYTHMNNALKQGVVRVIPGRNGGIEIGKPLTRVQAQILADDWNTEHRDDLNADFFYGMDIPHASEVFFSPVDAGRLKAWSERAHSDTERLVKLYSETQDPNSDRGAVGPFKKPKNPNTADKNVEPEVVKAKTVREKKIIKDNGNIVARKIINILDEAIPARMAQDMSDSAIRAQRFAASQRAFNKKGGGLAGGYSALGKLSGELPIVEHELDFKLTQKQTDDAVNAIFNSPLLQGQRIQAFKGLTTLLGLSGERVIQPRQIELLGNVFGKEFEQVLKSKSDEGFFILPEISGWKLTSEYVNLPKSLMGSLDVSAPFRQGLGMIHRGEFWNNLYPMLKALGNEEFAKSTQEAIKEHPDFLAADEAGLKLTELNTGRDERQISGIAEKIPVLGKLYIKPSNRAFNVFINKLRMDTFSAMNKEGIKFHEQVLKRPLTEDEISSFQSRLAHYINSATGRGNLDLTITKGTKKKPGLEFKGEKIREELNMVIFSPGLVSSRLDLLTKSVREGVKLMTPGLKWNVKEDPFVRRQYFKSLGAMILFAGTALGAGIAAMNLMGVKTGTSFDTRNPDFLKLRVGRVRLDFLGGLQQFFVQGMQIGHWTKVSSYSGRPTVFGEKYGSDTAMDDIYKFLESKESPSASYLTAFLRQKEADGEAFHFMNATWKRVFPIMLQDLKDLYEEDPALTLLIIPALFGVGVQVQDYNKVKPMVASPISKVRAVR